TRVPAALERHLPARRDAAPPASRPERAGRRQGDHADAEHTTVSARRLASLLVAAVALVGCAPARGAKVPTEGSCLPAGRNLFLARVTGEENRATAEAAAEMLMTALRDTAHVVGPRDLASEANLAGLLPWATSISARLQRGGRLSLDDTRTFWERFGI